MLGGKDNLKLISHLELLGLLGVTIMHYADILAGKKLMPETDFSAAYTCHWRELTLRIS
jgi:hypothetical protein